jgi:phospholipid/cholesterol/gamma-HCH transport system substrate-binding protein
MTVARGLALGALVLAAVLVAALLLGGGKTTEYSLLFQNAGQLVKDDDVQVGGRRIGSVREIKLTDDNQAQIKIEVEKDFSPLREGTRASIRATSLSGIANRYIALTPGPNNAHALKEGSVLTIDKTAPIVDLDQLFNTLDPKTRKSLQKVIQGSAQQYGGKGRQANAAAKYFNPAISTTREIVNELTFDSKTLQQFLIDGAKATSALAEKRETLTDLVSNSNEAAQGIADENAAFSQTLQLLPNTLRRANSTFVNLRGTLNDLDVLVNASKPATKDLARFLRELRPLVRDARPTIRDLRYAIRTAGPNNDLIDVTAKAPKLASTAAPSLQNTTRAVRKSVPVLDFIRPYVPDFTGWLREFGQAAAPYDANGHIARIAPNFNIFSFTDNPAGGTLQVQSPDDRLAGLQSGFFRRCPGGASQAAADNSAPYTDNGLDCDARQVLPGP